MRHGLLAGLVLSAVGVAALPAWAQKGRGRDDDAARHGWVSSLSEGKARARQTGKPLMIVLRCVP